ncbi:drug/metabolite transporter (DMT)-like permease [Saccharopolyspora lacisalsi]|uniref:Drug/metabolite transporter (DMT)-like permease n=1 Tax=Halosaccharopolyspora lacisalsi TaxID=1000566 RepID=A0A839E4F7_9PSEU|nr:EamA family transporter [Halosaccharopolyspora lacisalsi]MBA8826231.1 drug/metabolite transporter (DMT)-like permease [Halosaccharopolyspora lacisalsi]
MKPFHIMLAIAVAALWGIDFVVIDVGLTEFPPPFSAFRFVLCAIPAICFIGGPLTRWHWVFAVGVLLGRCMFGLMFPGTYAGMPAGLTSLVVQSQALFTVVFAAVLLRERPGPTKVIGLLIAAIGVAAIAIDYGTSSPFLAFGPVILTAAFWGLPNIASRKVQPPDLFRFMVWVSAVPRSRCSSPPRSPKEWTGIWPR